MRLTRRHAMAGGLATGLTAGAARAAVRYQPGFNLIQTPNALFGSVAAARSLARMKQAGASACAIIPFAWQSGPTDPKVVAGSDMTPDQLRAGIRLAREAGLAVTVKPHVWTPGGWAGQVAMNSDTDWKTWFDGYRTALGGYADIAAAEGAESFCVGTELTQSVQRPEWDNLIAEIRRRFPGALTFAAHGAENAEAVPFWRSLDAVGATVWPPLGADHDRAAWQAAMEGETGRLEAVATGAGKPLQVLEVGLRSAQGAAVKPWESAEERMARPAPALQAEALDLWMQVLDRPGVHQVLVWRWFTDPDAGGPADTDFTVQRKPAARRLAARWRR